ncbi:TPA: hypothetical protein ACGJ4S_000993 [Pseudomonas aeruginosa]|uniref:hypothetical protein n=1 Tax=Pseudomonas aeruginosa TaxID=287 RepID=UPI00053EC311|nr:hypothetical protein [Pseudomonas aeruginosa]
MKNAQIHRFGDRVAVSLPGKGETVYLSEKEARALARVLVDCARKPKNANGSTARYFFAYLNRRG